MMASIYKELLPVEFNEEEKRCALVMALINSQGKLTNKELCNILGLNARFVQRIRKRLEVDKENPRAIIKRKEKEIEDRRKARDESFQPQSWCLKSSQVRAMSCHPTFLRRV